MRHAGAQSLDALAELLARLREIPSLREKGRGVFYAGARALLHFHENPEGLFADLRLSRDWQRFPVNTAAERGRLLESVRRSLRRDGSGF